MSNKETFKALVSQEDTNAVEELKARIARRSYTRYSKKIALSILIRLDELQWKQKDLAEKMEVSPQQVNKWVKGNENFTLETLGKLSEILGVELIQVPRIKEPKLTAETKLPTSISSYDVNQTKVSITPVVQLRTVV
jgi:transcriptional regulator with XRE-family HTH domain